MIRCTSTESFLSTVSVLQTQSGLFESFAGEQDTIGAYCVACNRPTQMKVTLVRESGVWRNLLEGMVCECQLNGRLRGTLDVVRQFAEDVRPGRNVVLERVTPFFNHLRDAIPDLIGCEYISPDIQPGEMAEVRGLDVMHQDMMNFSFEDDSVDLLMHFDVLEHVPDMKRGLSEAFRVLRPGGQLIFTCPFFYRQAKHLIRAEVVEGQLVHYLPPAYHGNPVDDGGAFVFTHPGLQLFDDVRIAGFDVEIVVAYDPAKGVLSNGCPFPDYHVWPVVFHATKPEVLGAEPNQLLV